MNSHQMLKRCPTCSGRGTKDGRTCPSCLGTGETKPIAQAVSAVRK